MGRLDLAELDLRAGGTIVRQLIKEAEQQGAVALFGRCYESEGTVPYSPFVETTEQALRLVPPEWVREDLGRRRRGGPNGS